jgi:type II secretory pathway component PulL
LFDKDDQHPLALLSSLSPGASTASAEPKHWLASTGANGSASQRRFPQAHELETQVSERAGLNMNRYWIQRLPGGDGILQSSGRSILADQFPVLLMDESWQNEEEQHRVHEYIKWIAPSLLTLQHLDRETRQRLENNLHVQAISIEHHRLLYPAIIDQKLLKAARVQNQIEQCS